MKRKLTILFVCLCCTFQILATDNKKPSPSKTKSATDPENGIFAGVKESNLISNPGFENRTSKWVLGKLNGGSGLFTIDTIQAISGMQSALIETENQDQTYTDLQLFTFLQLSNQTKYSITFQADVKTACLISISFGNGFETFFEEKFLLRPDTKMYGPFTYNSSVDDLFSCFAFNLGKTKAKIRLDDVQIEADHTEREFNNVLAKSGINVHYNKSIDNNSIFISSPTTTTTDLPIILFDENNNAILTSKLRKGHNEANIKLDLALDEGVYNLSILTPSKQESINFKVE